MKAERAIKTALSIRPNDFKALLFLGDLYVINKEYPKAIDIFTEASNLEVHLFEVWERLGLCFEKIKEYESAITLYKGALEISLYIGQY